MTTETLTPAEVLILAKLREAYEERAAIKQFEGRMSREQAEKETREEVYGR